MSLLNKVKSKALANKVLRDKLTVKETVMLPRSITTSVKPSIAQMANQVGGKVNSANLIRVRNTIGRLFETSNLNKFAWKEAVQKNGLMNPDILAEKFGSYNAEFARLHKAVEDAFRFADRNDLAQDFLITVPQFTEKVHPVDYIATLLKGASNKLSVKAAENQYAVLAPFFPTMREVLKAKGLASPSNNDELTQLFYNTFVAEKNSNYEPMNFDTMLPSEIYYADEAIVNAVLAYVKTLSDKKAAGEVLPKTQDKIATAGLQVQERLTEVAKQEVNKEVGGFVLGQSKTILIIGVAVAALIIYLFLRK